MISVFSFGTFGMDSLWFGSEADYAKGLFSFEVVGLPDAAVQESKERVKAAIRNSGFEMRSGTMWSTLAPADVKKAGPVYDLPILMAILADSGQMNLITKQTPLSENSRSTETASGARYGRHLIAARQAGFKKRVYSEATATRAARLRASPYIRPRASTRFMRMSRAGLKLNPPCF
jgi:magnesium chelatase family protein